MPRGRHQRLPEWIRSDASHGVLHAYYTHVRRAEVWFPDADDDDLTTVQAYTEDAFVGADFSTGYELPADRGEAGVRRRLARRAEYLVRLSAVAHDPWPPVLLEVWCFFPPSQRLRRAAAVAPAPGCALRLIHGDEFAARVRQAVLAVPARDLPTDEEPETAFADCARTIRAAFGLRALGAGRRLRARVGRRARPRTCG